MKARVTVITLAVDDFERARRFYRDGLGLPTDCSRAPRVALLHQAHRREVLVPVLRLYETLDLA